MLKGKVKTLISVLSAVLFLVFAGASQAQYLGPGEMKADASVAQILKKPVDGQQVILKGYITQKFGKKYYEFKDTSGTIRVKINERLFYNQKVTESTLVEIFGEVDNVFTKSPVVEVFRLTVINP
ncbi:NirD/YgiW/YdeI family stress tolerance protein [Oxalobacter vibrioformis]|uniref:NirD/YgiW/YdeI family stress tolerance protein n=1 Tax=Oxalobacter vibrioformis TaxID=933080 RepID=A0A9E9LYP1_9BURK|nr:NirD/YgiW/YdeI family stress tolerance protein [Oxalobacter vibrioformis]WAW09924.1 NirD/YgiW/YdeI family stress tolerance protein [Oxalobacter vibrioformis]